MIALCATHHAKAAAWTVEDIRRMKTEATASPVEGRFEWMREDVLAVIGGSLYYETPNMIVFRDKPIIWFERDEERRLLLNVEMLTVSNEPRTSLRQNDWFIRGTPSDVDSPPNGSQLKVRYDNGDHVGIRFREWSDIEGLSKKFPRAMVVSEELRFPLLTAEIALGVGGTPISFDGDVTHVGGLTMTGAVMSRCGAGLAFS
jgi:hypothetical protein